MLTLIFVILMIVVFGKMIVVAIKAAWGISKVLCSIVLLPLALIILVLKGLVQVALPILLIVGVVSLISSAD